MAVGLVINSWWFFSCLIKYVFENLCVISHLKNSLSQLKNLLKRENPNPFKTGVHDTNQTLVRNQVVKKMIIYRRLIVNI